ncbi:adenylyl-sulfate kinase [Akkermansiaceae bacterium]|nr:adenylyl-sulfate kinase [Akkermansiaceae bacterium]MDB4732084.1 adenylyl-sulfate kinase [bacterium]MDB4258486.1 adenylyl-sulfate kinase [Akkermansiaceae bacterium]MDB4268289.1 adenylyl-sulfate kinase [Akkermansiaceae bacterium]MDB4328646.1 adenylyl-sulfate kinase [Akkermansiaceae bacterium]
MADNIHTQFHRFVSPEEKAKLLGQSGTVLWMYGLSGSGKSTIAAALERKLHEQGRFVVILDGDNFRHGLNSDLGFSDDDRRENVRRVSEVAKMFAAQGVITIVSVITPKRALREQAREIIGDPFHEIFIKASYETCAQRDPKGLYAKVAAGEIKQFTGKDSGFEEPENPDLTIDTEQASPDAASAQIMSEFLTL